MWDIAQTIGTSLAIIPAGDAGRVCETAVQPRKPEALALQASRLRRCPVTSLFGLTQGRPHAIGIRINKAKEQP